MPEKRPSPFVRRSKRVEPCWAALFGLAWLSACHPTAAPRNQAKSDPEAAPDSEVTAFSTSKPGRGQNASRAPHDCQRVECMGDVSGPLLSVLEARFQAAQACYQALLEQGSRATGRVEVMLRVGGDGRLCRSGIALTELGSLPEFERCVLGKLGDSFPEPKGGCVDIRAPLRFVSVEAPADGAPAEPQAASGDQVAPVSTALPAKSALPASTASALPAANGAPRRK